MVYSYWIKNVTTLLHIIFLKKKIILAHIMKDFLKFNPQMSFFSFCIEH